MYLDQDGFKAINDRHGHAAGDCVLHAFAAKLRGAVRSSDLVARLAGDEFVVMLEALVYVERDVGVVVDKIRQAAAAGVPWGGTVVTCTPSIGIAFQAGPVYSAEILTRSADEAMYRAKKARLPFAVIDCS